MTIKRQWKWGEVCKYELKQIRFGIKLNVEDKEKNLR